MIKFQFISFYLEVRRTPVQYSHSFRVFIIIGELWILIRVEGTIGSYVESIL